MRSLLPALTVVAALSGCQKPTHIEIEPKQPTIKNPGDAVQLIGRVMMGKNEDAKSHPTWKSQNESIATVEASGRLTCKSGGRVQVEAAFGPLTATVPVECSFVESLKVDVEKVQLSFAAGDPVRVKVDAIGYDGRPLKDRQPYFKPKDEKICRADGTGQFWPVAIGETSVTADVDGKTVEIPCIVGK